MKTGAKTKAKDIEKKLINLWENLKNSNDYDSISEVMRNYKEQWNGFKKVKINERNVNVFSIWTYRATKMLFHNYPNNGKSMDKGDFLKKLKYDVKWWAEHKGSPTKRSNKELIRLITSTNITASKMAAENHDLYEEWLDIWLNSGWIKDRSALVSILVAAVLYDNINVVKKIITRFNFDVNFDIQPCESINLGVRNEYFNPLCHSIKLGFFAKSEQMVSLLSEMGFNWNVNVCDNNPLLSVFQNKDVNDFKSKETWNNIVNLLLGFVLKSGSSQQSVVPALIGGVKYSDDLNILFKQIDFLGLRGEYR